MNRLFSQSSFQTIRSQSIELGKQVFNQIGKSYAHLFSLVPKGSKLRIVPSQFFKQKIPQIVFPKISLTEISTEPLSTLGIAQMNKIKPISGIGTANLLSSDPQQFIEKPTPSLNRNQGNPQRTEQIAEEAQDLQTANKQLDEKRGVELGHIIRNEYALVSEVSFEEPVGEILRALASLFSDQEDESLVEKGKEIFKSAIAEGKDQLSAFAREIEFKAAATLVKMADQGVIFKESEMDTNAELESQIVALQQKISEYSGHAFDQFRENIIEEKNRMIHSYIDNHFSFEISGHQSLKSLLDDIFESRTLQVLLGIRNMQGDINPQFQGKLSLIFQRENLEYMGVALLTGLKKILIALQESEGKDSEKMLEILRFGPHQSLENVSNLSTKTSLNIESYKKEVEQRVVNRLGNLILDQNNGEGIFHAIVKQYTGIKTQVRRLMIQALAIQCDKKKVEFLESLKTNSTSFSAKEVKIADKPQEFFMELIKEKIGLNSILERFDENSDLLFYFMLDTMTEALDEVITHPNPANRANQLDAAESASPLQEAVKNFTNHATTLLPASLKMILQPLMAIVEEQGNAKEVLDFTSPVLENMIPKMHRFLKT